ncbi:ABC transporter ATP-binding protein [Zobellella iuensis]|uniref:ABC transporter ATP-binding protein n=1 Tax=Zobellella iuensis TaxID=2803811 RepID=A0ABS1QN81_9GAMM|nr:ABC transporter ATP-binding protein [Zobellella iuensis]MBL1376318.1 ABC transporter ATP-binding protein [Zobellella iuensis]
MAEPLLEIRHLRMAATFHPAGEAPREITVADNVNLTLAPGKVLGLIGESGAGKSSIGLSSAGYARKGVRITAGEVFIRQRDILRHGGQALRRLRGREVCYVAQSAASAFNPARRLMDQVIESTLQHGLASRPEAIARAIELFRQLGLPDPEHFGECYPHQVSGGQLQRAMTAMALCPRPALIIFDEPTTALDVTTQLDVLASIKKAIRETGVSALYITHDLAVVAQVADHIMVLRQGKMVEYGETRQIIEAPREEYTRALVGKRAMARLDKPVCSSSILTVDSVVAAYAKGTAPTLDKVSLSLAPGQTLAVVGESGSGKSTLARVITGLLPPQEGRVYFDGHLLAPTVKGRSKQSLRQLQMIYQMADTAMNPRHTVGTIIGRPLSFYFGLQGKARRERTLELLDAIELEPDYIDRYPDELSGGQKQRVCIARALAAEPSVIICDEITSALDPLVADGILQLLLRLQKRKQVAYLFITHDLMTVRAIADVISVMHQGRVVRHGRHEEVLTPPFDDYTRKLLASVPQMRLGWLEEALAMKSDSCDNLRN